MRTTLKAVNDTLASLGSNVRLVKGDGYFYFDSGEAENWLDKTVSAATLGSRTVDEWVGEFHRLKELNGDLLQGRTRTTHLSNSKRSRPAKSRRSAP